MSTELACFEVLKVSEPASHTTIAQTTGSLKTSGFPAELV
jgi:hypothetical protein